MLKMFLAGIQYDDNLSQAYQVKIFENNFSRTHRE